MKAKNRKILLSLVATAVLGGGVLSLAYFKKTSKQQINLQQNSNEIPSSIEQLQAEENKQPQEQNMNEVDQSQVSQQQPAQPTQEKTQPVQKPQTEKPIAEKSQQSNSSEIKNSDPKIISRPVSWGFQKATDRKIKAVIVHTTYNALGGDPFDFDKCVQEWKDAGVSPHYAIDRSGNIYQLVLDQNIAYHAGVSTLPDGTTDVNAVSLGIEMVNTKDGKFTDAQYDALNYLLATLKKKYSPKYILGHDEIAPGRKTDPWGMDWSRVQK